MLGCTSPVARNGILVSCETKSTIREHADSSVSQADRVAEPALAVIHCRRDPSSAGSFPPLTPVLHVHCAGGCIRCREYGTAGPRRLKFPNTEPPHPPIVSKCISFGAIDLTA
jgi:hypothetical protein